MRTKRKYQSGGAIDTTGVRARVANTNSKLDSAINAKIKSGTKVWTPDEKAKWQKGGPTGGPPPGFKGFKKKK